LAKPFEGALYSWNLWGSRDVVLVFALAWGIPGVFLGAGAAYMGGCAVPVAACVLPPLPWCVMV